MATYCLASGKLSDVGSRLPFCCFPQCSAQLLQRWILLSCNYKAERYELPEIMSIPWRSNPWMSTQTQEPILPNFWSWGRKHLPCSPVVVLIGSFHHFRGLDFRFLSNRLENTDIRLIPKVLHLSDCLTSEQFLNSKCQISFQNPDQYPLSLKKIHFKNHHLL